MCPDRTTRKPLIFQGLSLCWLLLLFALDTRAETDLQLPDSQTLTLLIFTAIQWLNSLFPASSG